MKQKIKRFFRRLTYKVGGFWSWLNWQANQFGRAAALLAGGCGRTVSTWWQLRRFKLLLQSLPALTIAIAVLVIITKTALTRGSEIGSAYKEQSARKLAAGNYDGAMVCYQKLVQLNPQDPSGIYGLALCLDKVGQKDRAAALMARLAPEDRLGYGPAHFWVVKDRASRGGLSLQSLDSHLRFAWLADPENPEINAFLGQFYIDLKRPAEAEKYLVVAAKASQRHRLLLAQAYALQGKKDLLEIETDGVIETAKNKTFAAPEVPMHRLTWAEALLLRRDYAGAQAVLVDGFQRPSGQIYKRPLALLYVNWYLYLASKDTKSTIGDQLGVLQRGLLADPDCPEVIMAFYRVMQTDKKEADKIRQTLLKELANGKAVASIHFVLGSDAWEHNDLVRAKTHFEIAYQLEPSLALAANNLAWLMAFGEKPDLPRAKATIQSLVERWPDDPRFRGTRGHILAKLGNPKEALVDLIKALPVYGNTPELHERLAEVYSQLGLEASAAEHRALAKEKKKKS